MESSAPISDLITGTVLYNKMVEDVITNETDITLTEYRILFMLAVGASREARIKTLADSLILSTSTVSDAVKALESRSLVAKAEHVGDLKAVWAAITDDGIIAFENCRDIVTNETAEYWNAVGEETRQSYFSSIKRLGKKWIAHIPDLSDLPGDVAYPFVSRWHMLSYVSWFKSTYNLSLIDVRILMLLLEHDRPMSGVDIAHLLRISPSSISKSIRYLSRVREYIDRKKSGANKNEVIISLTEKGRLEIEEVRERFIKTNLDQFEYTREEFIEMLSTVHARKRKSYMEKTFGRDFLD